MAKKTILLTHKLCCDLQNGPLPLVERLDQPIGRCQALIKPRAAFPIRAAGEQFGIIAAVDEQPRQAGAINFNRPSRAAPRYENIRRQAVGGLPAKA